MHVQVPTARRDSLATLLYYMFRNVDFPSNTAVLNWTKQRIQLRIWGCVVLGIEVGDKAWSLPVLRIQRSPVVRNPSRKMQIIARKIYVCLSCCSYEQVEHHALLCRINGLLTSWVQLCLLLRSWLICLFQEFPAWSSATKALRFLQFL